MKLYWIYKKDNGDLELRSFHGTIRGKENVGFRDSPEGAIDHYRHNLIAQKKIYTTGLRKINEDVARLTGLEMEVCDGR